MISVRSILLHGGRLSLHRMPPVSGERIDELSAVGTSNLLFAVSWPRSPLAGGQTGLDCGLLGGAFVHLGNVGKEVYDALVISDSSTCG